MCINSVGSPFSISSAQFSSAMTVQYNSTAAKFNFYSSTNCVGSPALSVVEPSGCYGDDKMSERYINGTISSIPVSSGYAMIKAYSTTQSCINDATNAVTAIETFNLGTCILDSSSSTIYYCNPNFLIAHTYSNSNECSGTFEEIILPFSSSGTNYTCSNVHGNLKIIPPAAGYLRYFCESNPTTSPTTAPNLQSATPTYSSSEVSFFVQNEYNGVTCSGNPPHQNLYRLNT